MTRRLLVVIGDSPAALLSKGLTPDWMRRYYSVGGWFNEVRVLNVLHEQTDYPVPLLNVPREPALEGWRASLPDFYAVPRVGDDAFLEGWPGVPQSWLDAIREFGPHAVRGYDCGWAGWLAVQSARALELPSLVSAHNTMGTCDPVAREASCLMAVSEAVAQACIDAGADPSRVVTVFNRVDRERFHPDGEAADGPDGSPRLLSIARDTEQKNLDRLLAATARVHAELPDLRLVHIGRSDRDWSRWPFVHHLDSVPNADMPKWLRWADCLVLPSLWEGQPVVLLEALAAGTSVVTSNRDSMAEAVIDRWNGLLCNPEDEGDIARAIREISDPGVRNRLAAPARTASEAHDVAVIEARESALYRWLIDGPEPTVSVVLPTYNRAGMLKEAVENVLAQDYPWLELIVVNDGSTDDTPAVLEAITDPRLKVVRRENGGIANALNSGFEAATGEYLTWTSDDNRFQPGALRAMARELALDPELHFVFADYRLVREDGSSQVIRTGPLSELPERNVVGACFMYRRSLADAVGPYRPEHDLAEDYDWWMRANRAGNLRRLARVLYDYADNPGSLTHKRAAEVAEATLRLRAEAGLDNREYNQQLVRLAGSYKQQGMPGRSLGVALKLIRRSPLRGAGWWAGLRAVTPMPILRLSRRVRGLRDS